MEITEIRSVIKNSRALDISDDIIRKNLQNSKFDEEEINRAFTMEPPDVDKRDESNRPPAYIPQQPVTPSYSASNSTHGSTFPFLNIQKDTWYVIEQIIFFISLFVLTSAIFLTLHFDLQKWLLKSSADESFFIRLSLAVLMVFLPIFSYFFLSIMRYPQGYLLMRIPLAIKIITSLTVVIYFLVLTGSFIYFVFLILSGLLTTNSFLNFFILFFLSGIIFANYLLEILE